MNSSEAEKVRFEVFLLLFSFPGLIMLITLNYAALTLIANIIFPIILTFSRLYCLTFSFSAGSES